MPADAPRAGPVRLAIAIPAYSRAAATAASVAAMAQEARAAGLSIAFYVSDDTPDASVEEALRPLIDAGLPVAYRRNAPSLGHDRNLLGALQWPDADYVWLLGNRLRARAGLLAPILRFLEEQDLVFLNVHAGPRGDTPAVHGEDARALLRDRLWHQTLTGATIYGRGVRRWVAEQGSGLSIVRNFPQICVMLGFAAAHDPVIGWFDRESLEGADGEGSYWYATAVDVFARDWSDAVAAFPGVVAPAQRTAVIRAHSAHTNLFNTYHLVTLRQSGQFRWSSLRHPGTRAAMHLPAWKLLAIVALPVPLLRWGGRALGGLKRRLSAGRGAAP